MGNIGDPFGPRGNSVAGDRQATVIQLTICDHLKPQSNERLARAPRTLAQYRLLNTAARTKTCTVVDQGGGHSGA
jgi:hypothetical protein